MVVMISLLVDVPAIWIVTKHEVASDGYVAVILTCIDVCQNGHRHFSGNSEV